jgi:hypothetical protein
MLWDGRVALLHIHEHGRDDVNFRQALPLNRERLAEMDHGFRFWMRERETQRDEDRRARRGPDVNVLYAAYLFEGFTI